MKAGSESETCYWRPLAAGPLAAGPLAAWPLAAAAGRPAAARREFGGFSPLALPLPSFASLPGFLALQFSASSRAKAFARPLLLLMGLSFCRSFFSRL
ncbi:hypothetical protein CDD83_9625 [Cordyceps sp. RAO-2017]|nr:hypothetical protein CDD83_9625 [Cordyceps sp. RAO-2017]